MAEWRNTIQCRLTPPCHPMASPGPLVLLWPHWPSCGSSCPHALVYHRAFVHASAPAWSISSFLPHCCNLFFPTMSAQMPLPQERLCFTCFTKRPNSPATGIRRFTMLCFTAFHRCCALLQTEGMPCRQQKNYNSLYCDTRLIAAVWN